MVYNQKFVTVVKCNGKILREVSSDNDVILPFGAEYSLLFKNLDDRRAVVEVSIDGTDVLDGSRLVIDANTSAELKGVMINSAVKNAFKFIQKTEKIQDHRGDKIDDGFIRVKFGFERKLESITWTYPTVYRSTNVRSFYNESSDATKYGMSNEPMASSNISSSVTMDCLGESRAPHVSTTVVDNSFKPQMDEGITVPGSDLRQDFNSTSVGSIEDHGTIVIRLKGTDNLQEVKTPVFVSTKKECPTCGTKSRYGTKYCPECGTNLQA